MVLSKEMRWFTIACIFANCFTIALTTKKKGASDGAVAAVLLVDLSLAIYFTLEMIMKIIALGVFKPKGAYFRSGLQLDARRWAIGRHHEPEGGSGRMRHSACTCFATSAITSAKRAQTRAANCPCSRMHSVAPVARICSTSTCSPARHRLELARRSDRGAGLAVLRLL